MKLIKLITGSIPFSNRKNKERKKSSNERKKMNEENSASENINSDEVIRTK